MVKENLTHPYNKKCTLIHKTTGHVIYINTTFKTLDTVENLLLAMDAISPLWCAFVSSSSNFNFFSFSFCNAQGISPVDVTHKHNLHVVCQKVSQRLHALARISGYVYQHKLEW